ERETSVRNILDHRRHDFEVVAEPLEPAEHVEPEVLVSGVTERQDSRPDDEDPQVLPPPNDRYPDALFEIRFSPRTTSDGRRASRRGTGSASTGIPTPSTSGRPAGSIASWRRAVTTRESSV